MGNLFIEEGLQLVSVHMKDVMDAAVVNSAHNVPKIGEQKEQFKNFVKEQFFKRSKRITDSLKKKKNKKIISKDKAEVKVSMDDCALFWKLYIACQRQDGNLEKFFMVLHPFSKWVISE